MINTLSQELAFQQFYNNIAKQHGLNLNPDDPRHYYDHRAAYNAYGPEALQQILDETGHWPSEFKKEGNNRTILNGVDTRTGLTSTDPKQYLTPFSDSIMNTLESRYYGMPNVGVAGKKGF